MQKISVLNPFVIFWLGVLTGALLVGLLFLYKVTDSDFSASVLTPQKQYKTGILDKKAVAPQSAVSSKKGSVSESNPSPGI
ncbi:hypothetical protein HZC21_04590 [Candidatus Peregrinibacteria bacterium]|nr:hypothetical protein [Candidatus Peregrinibacteria bacterium]